MCLLLLSISFKFSFIFLQAYFLYFLNPGLEVCWFHFCHYLCFSWAFTALFTFLFCCKTCINKFGLIQEGEGHRVLWTRLEYVTARLRRGPSNESHSDPRRRRVPWPKDASRRGNQWMIAAVNWWGKGRTWSISSFGSRKREELIHMLCVYSSGSQASNRPARQTGK